MRYVRADEVFPSELLKEINVYITDGLVYFPTAKEKRLSWGEASGEKERIESRNREIKDLFKKAQVNVEALAVRYNLSVETIKNIVYRKCSYPVCWLCKLICGVFMLKMN